MSSGVKILFKTCDPSSPTDETMWAECVGPDRYELNNSPFFAYGVSWKDVVLAPHNASEGFRVFQRVDKKSGNRTVRILFPDEGCAAAHLEHLVSMGCSYEGANKRFFAINLPPQVDLDEVCDYLTNIEVHWEYVDPTYADLFPEP